tara:strand:- start:80 stop:373 length:294 start_codon:yes stop_codon:yes gene_type:complete
LREDHGKCTRLLAEIAAMNVKFHLSQDKISQSIVMTVFQITSQKVEVTEVAVEDLVVEAMVDDMAEIEMEEEELAVMEEIAVAVIDLEEIDHGKCTK